MLSQITRNIESAPGTKAPRDIITALSLMTNMATNTTAVHGAHADLLGKQGQDKAGCQRSLPGEAALAVDLIMTLIFCEIADDRACGLLIHKRLDSSHVNG